MEKARVESLEPGSSPVARAEKPTNIRWEVLFLMAFCAFVSYCDRINFSVAAPMIMDHFGIDKVQLGIVMAAFFIPYAIFQVPGGMLAQRWGTRGTLALCLAWWSLFTIFTPMAWGFMSLIVIRALFAIGEAPLSPSMSTISNRWSNSIDKGKATVFVIIGSYSGPIVGAPLTSWILRNWDWQVVFYSYGIFGMFLAAFWYWHHRSFPYEHPRVNKAEHDYIMEDRTREQSEAAAKASLEHAPWGKFLMNYRFWAFGFAFFSLGYVMFLVLSWLPMYLLEARGLDMKAMGYATAYPWMAIITTCIGFGWISDWMTKKGLSKIQTRTIPGCLCLALCGCCLYLASGATTLFANLFWFIMSFGFLGVCYVATLATCLDIGKRFGGSVYSWIGTFTCIAGVLAPIITPMIVQSIGWQAALNFAACVPIAGAILFAFVRPDIPLPGTEDKAAA